VYLGTVSTIENRNSVARGKIKQYRHQPTWGKEERFTGHGESKARRDPSQVLREGGTTTTHQKGTGAKEIAAQKIVQREYIVETYKGGRKNGVSRGRAAI